MSAQHTDTLGSLVSMLMCWLHQCGTLQHLVTEHELPRVIADDVLDAHLRTRAWQDLEAKMP